MRVYTNCLSWMNNFRWFPFNTKDGAIMSNRQRFVYKWNCIWCGKYVVYKSSFQLSCLAQWRDPRIRRKHYCQQFTRLQFIIFHLKSHAFIKFLWTWIKRRKSCVKSCCDDEAKTNNKRTQSQRLIISHLVNSIISFIINVFFDWVSILFWLSIYEWNPL